jgi:hypothetical protein
MKIRRMTNAGRLAFLEYLAVIRSEGVEGDNSDLLSSDNGNAEDIGGDTEWLDRLNLDDKLEAAKGLDDIVSNLGLTYPEKDWGFWSWCSAYLFQRLCKTDKSGAYKVGEDAVWVAEPDNWKRYYRHYLASIWQVFRSMRDKEQVLKVLLFGSVNTPGELWAQVASRQTLITNPSVIETSYQLYWDDKQQGRKRGSGGESPRRFADVLGQFAKTYDFFAMNSEQILALLPSEFNKFKPDA